MHHTHTPHPATHRMNIQKYRTRARANTLTCIHTYTLSPPPPSLLAEEKGARRGGGEGRWGDGRARRCWQRCSFPFDLGFACSPFPSQWGELGPGRVQSEPRKTGKYWDQPVGDWRESSAGTLIQRTVDPARSSSSLHPPQTLCCRDLCSPPLGVGRWGLLLPRSLPERLGNCYGWRTLLVLTRSLDLQTSFFSETCYNLARRLNGELTVLQSNYFST